MKCLYCQKPIGFVDKLINRRFCSEQHRQQYQENQQSNAFATLLDRAMSAPLRSKGIEKSEPEEKESQAPVTGENATGLELLAERSLISQAESSTEIHGDREPSECASPLPDSELVSSEETEPVNQTREFESTKDVEQPVMALDEEVADGLGLESAEEATSASAMDCLKKSKEEVALSEPEEPEHAVLTDNDHIAPEGEACEPVAAETPESMAKFLAKLDYERHFFQEILDHVPMGIAILTKDLDVQYSNQSFRELRGANGTIRSIDSAFRQSIVSLVARLADEETDRAEEVVEAGGAGTRSPQYVSAVKLPLRDVENPEMLVVVANATSWSPESE